MKRVQRKKGFLGAAIGIASILSSIIGSAINANNQKKAAQSQADAINEQNRQNRIAANQQNTSQLMQNMNRIYNNNDYLDSFYDRFNTNTSSVNTQSSLRCGGKRKAKRCGGKKAELGTIDTNANNIRNKFDTSSLSQIGNIFSSIINTVGNSQANNILSNAKIETYRPTGFNIAGYTNNGFNDRFSAYKCGGKRKR